MLSHEEAVISVDINPYRIIMVVDKDYISDVNDSAIFMSMDTATWIFTLISVGTLAQVLHHFGDTSGQQFWFWLPRHAIELVGLLLGQ